MKTSLKSDDQAIAISLDFILAFTITVFIFVIVFIALGGYLTSANEFIMREKFKDIGNEISTKMVNIYNIGGKNGYAYTWVKLPNDVNGLPFDVKIVGNGSDGNDPVRIIVAAQRLNAETYVTVNELGENVEVESNVLTSGSMYTVIYENFKIHFYQGIYDFSDPPTPVIYYPIEGGFVSGNLNVLVKSDPDTEKIDFYNSSDLDLIDWDSFGTDENRYDGWSSSYNTSVLNDGDKISFRVNATDVVGKNGTSPVVNVTVDNTPPEVNHVSPEEGAKIHNSPPIYIHANYSDSLSGIDVTSVKMEINYGLVDRSKLEINDTDVIYKATLGDGDYTVTVYVKDKAGNENSTTWSFSVKLPCKYLQLKGGFDSSDGTLVFSRLLIDDGNTDVYKVPTVPVKGMVFPQINQTYYFNISELNETDVIESLYIAFKEYNKINNITAELHLYNNSSFSLGVIEEFGVQSFVWMDSWTEGNRSYWNSTGIITGKKELDDLRLMFTASRIASETGPDQVRVDYVNVSYCYYYND